eukprot:Colp12_sorted_trinity150504_noHs@1892
MQDNTLPAVTITVACIMFCVFLSYVVTHKKFYYLPESGATMLLGLFTGIVIYYTSSFRFDLDAGIFFYYLLPPLLFDSGYSLKVCVAWSANRYPCLSHSIDEPILSKAAQLFQALWQSASLLCRGPDCLFYSHRRLHLCGESVQCHGVDQLHRPTSLADLWRHLVVYRSGPYTFRSRQPER